MLHNINSKSQIIKFCTIGSVLEWYDFIVFGVLSPILAQLFFPLASPTASLIAAFGVFASGFIMRPIGAMVLGHIGDKYGRKTSLLFNMVVVTIATTMMGLLPTYNQAGILAPITLVLLRLAQGFFVGAEYTAVVTYLAETSEKKNRCLFSSFSVLGTSSGLLLGSLVGALTIALSPKDYLLSFGWRLPFLLSVLLGVVGYQIRKKLHESPVFMQLKAEHKIEKFPIASLFKEYHLPLLMVIALYWTPTAANFLAFIYMPAKLSTQLHVNRGLMLLLSSIGLTIFPLLIPVFGNLADKIGRIKMLKIGIITYFILAYPAFNLLLSPHPLLILLGYLCFALATAMFVAPLPATIATLFPSKVRCSGTSVGVNISASVFGGTTPLIATWLVAHFNNPNASIYYLLISILISIVFVWQLGRMKEYL